MRMHRIQRRQEYVVAAVLVHELEEARGRRRPISCWVKPWLQRRVLLGQYDTLMHELMRESHGDFKNYMRMEVDMFREILTRIASTITKSTESRPPIRAGLKLAVTIRFLATGNSYTSLSYEFRVAYNTICLFVSEVCDAIVAEYRQEQFSTPSDPDGWRQVANFRWNFPHSCGAIDRKHVAIRKPDHAGSLYYNYKRFHSILILALVDAGVFQRCSLETALRDGTLGLPDPDTLPNDDRDTPYFIVGDDAFPLRKYLQNLLNYILSRARRVVENAFGILSSRFRVLHTTMQVRPHNATTITKACLVLHNIMRDRYPRLQNEQLDEKRYGIIVPGSWRAAGVLVDCEREATIGARTTREGRFL